MLRPAAITLLALLPLAAFAQTQEPKKAKEIAPTVLEPETEIEFPIWLDHAKLEDERHHLCGTGVREKTIFKVNVYGFAWYVERESAVKFLREELSPKMTLKKARKEKSFSQAMLSDKFNKSMRWVMARDVDGEDVAEAFDEFLEPGIRKIVSGDKALKAGLKAMGEMRDYFASGKLRENDELIFLWETGGKMHTCLNGRLLGSIENYHLCYAMFEVFVGPDPIDDDGKRNIVEGIYPYIFPDQ